MLLIQLSRARYSHARVHSVDANVQYPEVLQVENAEQMHLMAVVAHHESMRHYGVYAKRADGLLHLNDGKVDSTVTLQTRQAYLLCYCSSSSANPRSFGLPNIGNTCYLAAAVQAIYSMPELVQGICHDGEGCLGRGKQTLLEVVQPVLVATENSGLAMATRFDGPSEEHCCNSLNNCNADSEYLSLILKWKDLYNRLRPLLYASCEHVGTCRMTSDGQLNILRVLTSQDRYSVPYSIVLKLLEHGQKDVLFHTHPVVPGAYHWFPSPDDFYLMCSTGVLSVIRIGALICASGIWVYGFTPDARDRLSRMTSSRAEDAARAIVKQCICRLQRLAGRQRFVSIDVFCSTIESDDFFVQRIYNPSVMWNTGTVDVDVEVFRKVPLQP